jgi:hypothetical protein
MSQLGLFNGFAYILVVASVILKKHFVFLTYFYRVKKLLLLKKVNGRAHCPFIFYSHVIILYVYDIGRIIMASRI